MSDKPQDPMSGRGSYVKKRSKKSGRPAKDKAATYRIGEKAIDRVNNAANFYHVQKGDFVRFLLNYAIDQLEAGAVELPAAKAPPRKL